MYINQENTKLCSAMKELTLIKSIMQIIKYVIVPIMFTFDVIILTFVASAWT